MTTKIAILKRALKWFGFTLLVILSAYLLLCLIIRPSLNRDWSPDQALLSRATFRSNSVSIANIRDLHYRTTTDYDVRYYDKTFDLEKLDSVWFLVEPFSEFSGAAHTLLSFGFENGDYVAISAEIRKEKGETFSALKGLFRQFELAYVIADERDVIKLRSNFRRHQVFLYPVQTSREKMKQLFLSMLHRANKLASEPEFYNTLWNTCTTSIVSHVNEIAPGQVPFSCKILLPAYSDQLAYNLGLLDNSVPLETLRARHLINPKAEKFGDHPSFSQKIRGLN